MKDLHTHLGFLRHPFSKFSAEEENEYLSEIYIRPRYFDTLLTDLKSGSSRFILGERGSGKSALIFELQKQLLTENVFTIIIDNYEGVPIVNNDCHLLHLIIKNLIKSYSAAFIKNKHLLKRLSKTSKQKLSLFVRDFFTSISTRDFESAYNCVSKYKSKNFVKNIYNNILNKPVNWAISVGLEITSDFISKSLNLPKPPATDFYKNYLPQIKIEELSNIDKEKAFVTNYKLLKDILLELAEIIKESGYQTTVVFLDKIDEFRLLEGKINNIVKFTENILKDTNLLYFDKISLVFSIWTEVKIELNANGVRFDKFRPIDISWTNEDIKNILNKRLNYFAIKKPFNTDELFFDKNDIDGIINISNRSPRDLIRLLSTIFDEQALEKANTVCISSKAVIVGKSKFCQSYDYYSIFPSKRGTKEDILSIVERILKVNKVVFKTTDLMTLFKFSSQSGNNYIKIYKDYGLVKDYQAAAGSTKEYIVVDPKLVFLIESGHCTAN